MTKYSAIICSIICFVIFLITACDKEEKIPTFLSINSIGLKATPLQESTSHKIKDVWVYIDGQILGAYEMPARFPVLEEGNHTVTFAAGILVDGISATRVKYPFFNFFDTTLVFIPGQTINLADSIFVKYNEGQANTWYEGFEGGGFTFAAIPSSDAQLLIENSDVFEGARSSKFILTNDDPIFSGQMQDGYPITTQSSTFFELNYKAEQPFAVGMTVITGASSKNVYVATVNKSAAWNKIYIDVSKVVNENQSSLNSFRIYIYAALESGRNQSIIYLDNLKLLHN